MDKLPLLRRLHPLLSLSRFLFSLLLVFSLQVLSETVLDTSSPILVTIFFVGVALRPVPPALPHLGAGAGGGASQGDIRATRMSRHVGCERVVLGLCQS